MLDVFVDGSGKPLIPSLIGNRELGINGEVPDAATQDNIQKAIVFAVLDKNPREDHSNAGWFTLTTENAEIEGWQIDLEHGFYCF